MRNRIYTFKDVEMLLASKTIVNSFIRNLPDLAPLRTNWDEEYGNQLLDRIDKAIEDYLGLNKKEELVVATDNLKMSIDEVTRDLGFLRTQIRVDLPDEAEKILKRLGYSKYGDQVGNHDQEALIELLYMFRKEMDDNLKSRVCAGGIDPGLIDRIMGNADKIRELNIIQESLKKTTKEVTADIIGVYNGIYEEVLGICKIARSYYRQDPLKMDQFVFSGTVSNMNLEKNQLMN